MSGASPRPSVRTAVLNGMQKAYSSYQKMSGDSWPMTPEFFIATYVAKELKKTADPCLVTLEANIKNTLTAAGAQRPGPSASYIRGSGNFDIVLSYKMNKPRAIIEVKRLNVAKAKLIEKDVKRVCVAVSDSKRNGGSLKFGIFAFLTRHKEPKAKHNNAKHRIEEHLKNIEKECRGFAVGCTAKMHKTKIIEVDKDNAAWTVSAIFITAKSVKNNKAI